MSLFSGFSKQNAMDERDQRLIDAEVERVGTHLPIGLQAEPSPSAPLPTAFSVHHTLEWSTSMSPKTRNLEDLRSWVWRELGSGSNGALNSTDKVSRHLGAAGSIGEINARIDDLLNRLNRATGFAEDGLSLLPGDVPSDPTVNQLLKAVVSDYERREVEVIL